MGIANYTNLSELMNAMLKKEGSVSISAMAEEAEQRRLILASEGTLADKADLENAFIALDDALYRTGSNQARSGKRNRVPSDPAV